MTTLYVCVDESGNRDQHTCFAVSGCWFVSPRSNPQNVLGSTKDRLLTEFVSGPAGGQPGELKGASLHPRTLDDVIAYLRRAVYDDPSLEQDVLPWQLSLPVVYTVTTMSSGLFLAALEDHVGRLDAFELMQITALSSVLHPFYRGGVLLDDRAFSEIRVLFDSSTWENAARTVRSATELPNVSFEIRDSRSTPGIQLADLAAYAWFQLAQNGRCRRATGLLHDMRFAR